MARSTSPSQRGIAAVEFLLCLPLLILLLLPVVDLARVLQANIILTNIAREGANLSARALDTEQTIMNSLAATAERLDMRTNGAIRVTKIVGQRVNGITRNVIVAQHRWAAGSQDPDAGVWRCGTDGTYWEAGGACAGLAGRGVETDVMRGRLNDGEVAYLVESFYRFPLLFSGLDLGLGTALARLNPDLYAYTIF